MNYADILRDKIADFDTKRNALLDKAEAITKAAADESRAALTADEDSALASVLADIKAIDDNEERKGMVARLAEIEAAGEKRGNAKKAPIPGMADKDVDPLRVSDSDARARAIMMVERSTKFVSDEHREELTKKLDQRGSLGAAVARMALTTHSDEYERGWSKYMTGNHFGLTEGERNALAKGFDQYSPEERANMTSGTGSTGGYLVPVFVDPTMILTGAGAVNPIRGLSTVKTIGPAFGGWYGATAAQVTAAWTAEGAAAPDNGPTITQPNIPTYMAEAFAGVSFQAFEDIADLAADVVMLFADAKNNLEADAHATGSGSSQPTGVVTAVTAITASRVSPATGGVYALADAFSVHSALPARFYNSTSLAWAGSRAMHDKSRQLAMAQNSANSVWTDIANGLPARFIGDQVVEASSMSSSFTTGQNVLLYGDFSRYYIVDRVGFTTEFIPNLFDTSTGRPIASRGWLSHWRTGANVVDANAFRILKL